MNAYIALFESVQKKDGARGYSVVFPDLPGLITAGKNYAETYQMAHEGLASHITYLKSKGCPIPAARTLEQIEATWPDWPEWRADNDFLVVPIVPLPVTTKSKRINIFINESLLAALDQVTHNRSEYIAKAIEHSLHA